MKLEKNHCLKEIIQQQLIEKWDGKQPIQIGGEGVIVDAAGK